MDGSADLQLLLIGQDQFLPGTDRQQFELLGAGKLYGVPVNVPKVTHWPHILEVRTHIDADGKRRRQVSDLTDPRGKSHNPSDMPASSHGACCACFAR